MQNQEIDMLWKICEPEIKIKLKTVGNNDS